MEFRDVVAGRRMVRNYLPDPVPTESLDRMVDAGLRAPSAGFSQGLGFVVVTDPKMRLAIAALADEGGYVASGFDPWISRAPAHIVITVSEEAYRARYREPDKLGPDGEEIEWTVPYWWVDAGAGLMAILLAAVDERLAAGFLGIHAVPELAALLHLPTDHQPIGVVTVGKPAPDHRSSSLDRGRRSRESVVHWETWDD
jgi:FMN reductase [NAD(P)H]